MSRCEASYVWRQGRGGVDPRRGRVHRCILPARHVGGHLYEPTAAPPPAPTFFAWLPRARPVAPPVKARTDEERMNEYRATLRQKAWGR